MMDDGMVIVGAGEAGARAASSLREQGYAGPVTLVGDEAHGPYERPPLSKAVMTASDEAGVPPVILDEAKLAAQSIRHVAGVRATRIEREGHRLLLDDGRALAYRKLLIATGAGPRRLSTPGASDANVLYLRSFADALALRARLRPGARLIVIGGGFIGLEIAASAIARGCTVTLVEMAPRILMRGVPAEVAARVAARHRAAGVTVLTGVGLERIERRGEGEAVVLADGTILTCDAVVAGVGAVPETRLAEASGLPIENGVRVDARLRTEDPDIHAAATAAPSRIRSTAAAGSGSKPGATRRTRATWRPPTCWAARRRSPPSPGSGRTSTTRPCRWPGFPTRRARWSSGGWRERGLFFHLDAAGRLVAASGIGPNGLIARDIRLAEMLIARRVVPDPAALASPEVKLKGLLR